MIIDILPDVGFASLALRPRASFEDSARFFSTASQDFDLPFFFALLCRFPDVLFDGKFSDRTRNSANKIMSIILLVWYLRYKSGNERVIQWHYLHFVHPCLMEHSMKWDFLPRVLPVQQFCGPFLPSPVLPEFQSLNQILYYTSRGAQCCQGLQRLLASIRTWTVFKFCSYYEWRNKMKKKIEIQKNNLL